MLCAHGDTYTGRDKVITQDNMPFTRNEKDLLVLKAWSEKSKKQGRPEMSATSPLTSGYQLTKMDSIFSCDKMGTDRRSGCANSGFQEMTE